MMWHIFGLLVTIVVVSAAPSSNDCMVLCPFIYDPVCDAEGNSYDNACMLSNAACLGGKEAEPVMCLTLYDPVCGSDGNTYDNQCELDARECLGVFKVSDGVCTDEKKRAVKACDTICTTEYAPLCGTDGKMYSNSCQLQIKSCLTNGAVGLPICLADYVPVCGSDGQTYGNECSLQSRSCFGVTKVSDGECETSQKSQNTCQNICEDDVYEPVCGSDGVLYSNACALEIASCVSDGEISFPMCPMHYLPVCGSDGETYGNQCMLNAVACLGVESADWTVCNADKRKRKIAELLRSFIRQ